MSTPDFNGTSAEYYTLIRVRSTGDVGTEWNFAVGPSSVATTGYEAQWYGSVVTHSELKHDAGESPFPRVIIPDFSFNVARTDANNSTVDTFVEWLTEQSDGADRVYVSVYLTGSKALDTDADKIFLGYAEDDGVSITAEGVAIKASGMLKRYKLAVPGKTIKEEHSSDGGIVPTFIPDEVEGDCAGILYGDWWSDEKAFYYIACPIFKYPGGVVWCHVSADNGYGIDDVSTLGHYYEYEQEPEREVISGSTLVGSYFTINDDFAGGHIEASDDRSVVRPWKIYGLVDSDGDVIESPAAIIYDLLTGFAGVSESMMDAASFAAVEAAQAYRFRNHITDDTDVFDLVEEVLRDAGLILVERAGVFYLYENQVYFWDSDQAADLKLNGALVAHSQTITHRPSDWNCVCVRLKYRYNPRTEKYTKTKFVGDDTGERIDIESRWIWRDQDADDCLAAMETALLDTTPVQLEATIPLRLDVAQNQIVQWDGDGLAAAQFVVLRTHANLQGADAKISAAAINRSWYYGGWCLDTDPDFDDATEAEKIRDGYQCGDSPVDDIEDYTRWR